MLELRYFNDFEEQSEEQRDAYVASELRRIVADGEPLLLSVLRVPDDEARTAALTLLRDNATELGDRVFETAPGPFRLRLAADASPPLRDPQNRLTPEAKRGKVLIAKLGNKGGRLPEKASGKTVAQFSGKRRQILVSGGADLYETAEIGRDWKAFSQREATLILRTWGVGVQTQASLTHMQNGEIIEGQSFYLVEEDAQPRELAASPESTETTKGRKPPKARG